MLCRCNTSVALTYFLHLHKSVPHTCTSQVKSEAVLGWQKGEVRLDRGKGKKTQPRKKIWDEKKNIYVHTYIHTLIIPFFFS